MVTKNPYSFVIINQLNFRINDIHINVLRLRDSKLEELNCSNYKL